MKIGFAMRMSIAMIGMTLCTAAIGESISHTPVGPPGVQVTERFVTKPLVAKHVHALALSFRTKSENGNPGYTLENAVCNFSNELSELEFDWPSAKFFTKGGGGALPNSCKRHTRDGITKTDVDDKANVLLTTQRIAFPATTYRRHPGRGEGLVDQATSRLFSTSETASANGSDVSITTYFREKRITLVVENGMADSAMYLALPAMSDQTREGLIRQLRSQGQSQGLVIATKSAFMNDLRSEQDRQKFNQFYGDSVTYLVKLALFQKIQLVWDTTTPTASAEWVDLSVVVVKDGALTAGFQYASVNIAGTAP